MRKVLLGAVCAAFVMAGCSGGGDEGADTTAPPTTESTTTTKNCPPGELMGDSGCEPYEPYRPSSTTTTAAPTTTTPPLPGHALSAEAKQAVIDCAAGQAYQVSLIVNGTQASSGEKAARSLVCDLASDHLDAESSSGDNPVRELAVKLAGNSLDLASWELAVTLGLEIGPGMTTGLWPNQAIGWEVEMRDILEHMPTR